jgi:hydroxymethylbilane synthase
MRLGTRGSALALAQAGLVAGMLGDCEIVPITTSGDRGAAVGDKSRWVGALEQALAAGEIDLAVHSAKDVPGELGDGLALLGVPARAPSEDVLCGAGTLAELEPGARVGTSSIRRMAQLRVAREDLDVVALRGNVDTRLTRLAEPERELRAIVLARAGLARLGREDELGGVLDPRQFVPAPGQGVIALEGRAEDSAARARAESITDAVSFACLRAERSLAHELGASCHTPMGALAEALGDGGMRLRGWVGLPDGSVYVLDELEGELAAAPQLGVEVSARMAAAGARELLLRAEEMAGVGGF